MADSYPQESVRALLPTALVSDATREALAQRLEASPSTPRFFAPAEWETLIAVARRLFPQAETPPESLIVAIDERLTTGGGDGWRYSNMPPDGEAYRDGLRGLDETAQARIGSLFINLTDQQQDGVLTDIQQGNAPGETWTRLSQKRFFEELLAEMSEIYFSHPLAQATFGYVGMADGRGWTRIGLDEREPHEPIPNTTHYDLELPQREPAPRAPALPPMRRYSPQDEVDAVVIGTGAGGAPLLARLAAARLKVIALEAGQQWEAGRDFATDERAQTKLFWRDERLSAGENAVAFGSNNSGIGVGGSTLHFTAYTPRPQPDDFHLHQNFGVGVDWPIGYDDLAPYLDELEQFLGVSGPSPYPWGAPRKPYPLAPLPLNGAAQLMERGCAALGIRTSPAPNAALSAPYYQPGVGWRAACTNRGFCQAGCTTGAKASMDVTFIPLAIGAGAEIRAECFVTGFERHDDGKIRAVIYLQNGVEVRQPCRAVFLCAGAVETPRLLLINGLANSSGQVGRHFMAHTGLQVWGRFDQMVRPYKGIPGGLISEDTHRPADADFAGGYLLQSIGVMPVTYASQLARGRGLWGDAVHEHMRQYNHTAGINILGECLPYEGNFLELSDEVDGRGLPKPRIHFSYGENEQRLTAHAEKTMRAIWEAAGAEAVWAFPRSAHVIGTCRMGNDADTSVVNAQLQTHDIPNLYVCDNSVFPSALSVNPALTIMALSLRCADQFLSQRQT